MKKIFLILSLIFFSACTENRIKRYQNILDRHVGVSKQPEMNKILGDPTHCTQESEMTKCEYRTAKGRNETTPDVFKKQPSYPDLSPYEHFDVLELYYNPFGYLKDWQPIVLPH